MSTFDGIYKYVCVCVCDCVYVLCVSFLKLEVGLVS